MPKFVPVEELFKGRHFDQEIVILCVRWYLSFKVLLFPQIASIDFDSPAITRTPRFGGLLNYYRRAARRGGVRSRGGTNLRCVWSYPDWILLTEEELRRGFRSRAHQRFGFEG